ncbi:MAG: DUF6785 family protein [Armatimonadota bacterium]|nr:DUF6785 family protein [Armatimonadota bacterium]
MPDAIAPARKADRLIERERRPAPSVGTVAIGLLAALILSVVTPYSDLVMQGTWIGLTSFPISAFFVLCLSLFVRFLLRKRGIEWTRDSLIIVYAMALVAAGIPSFGWTGLLIPYIAGPFYFARPENGWAQIIQPHLPRWLHPSQPETFVWLYEGIPSGVGIPWGEWVGPLFWWTVLGLSVYLVFFALSVFFRKPWVDQERLVFPLTQLPLEMTLDSDEKRPAFFADPFVRLTSLFAICVHSLNGLKRFLPWLPEVNVHLISLDPYLPNRPWSAIKPFWIRIPFSIIGLTYLLPVQTSFSLWFFYFFFLAQQVVADWLGFPLKNVQAYPVRDFVAHQMVGGILLYSVYVIGIAIQRWRRQTDKETEEPEGLPGPFIGWGILLGFLVTCLWGFWAGASFHWTGVLFLLFYLLHIIAVRLVCEAGMLYVQHPFRPINILLAAFGSEGLGIRRLPLLVLFDHLLMVDNRSPLMPSIVQGIRLGDAVSCSRSGLLFSLVASVLVAVPVSYVSYLLLMYRYGGQNLHQWFTAYYTRDLYCTWTAHLMTVGESPNPIALMTLAGGAATMGVLLYFHRHFLWFPFAPVGYLMGASWPMINFWFPILVGWLLKALVVRYGGGKVYRRLIGPFLGLMFGEFFCAGLWVLIDLIAGVRGHVIFSF